MLEYLGVALVLTLIGVIGTIVIVSYENHGSTRADGPDAQQGSPFDDGLG